jgi:hypothetical protein
MRDDDTRLNNGRGAVRLENDRICVFERDGVYQARIRTEANRYLWRSLKTRSQAQAISAARRLFHSIEFRQQSGLPLTNRSAEAAYELDAFKPNLTRTEADIRIAMLTAKLKLLDGPPHTL